ncbi:MAG: DUF3611 family protein [Goleter apudmare HA4340-LM2]|nr:DUF3611 family protein [Goleter apudmare HA4340-LM2]
MESKLARRSLAPMVKRIAKTLYLTGWISLWVQLALALVSGLVLLVAGTGRNFAEQSHPALGVGIFWAGWGILVLLFSVYWDFRYTRLGKRLLNPKVEIHPSKADTLGIIRLGIVVSLVGILLTILGAGATASVLVAKAVSQPPGVAITDPNRIIRALDVFVMVANINGIAAHFVGAVASLWLLERVHQH